MNINIKITRQENADYFHTSVGSVVSVNFEEYVAAVVASELASGSLEAMKAQAVAARTFACCLGALKGKAISDSSATAQAYRAARYDAQKYPRCIEAAQATAGEILTYKGKPINAVYSDSNGGRTVSASERWGSSRPYLIAKTDPWDLAATGGNRRGHGVGMSQQGAKRMAAEGIGYREILEFYYPGCQTSSVSAIALPPSHEGEGQNRENQAEGGDDLIRQRPTALPPSPEGEGQKEVKPMGTVMNDKTETIVTLARSMMGYPYVFGALGEMCTPQTRGRRVNANHPTIKSKCQVLSGKASTCEGCPYKGARMFDCRGFTWYLLQQVGVSISNVGATTQWKTSSWTQKGEIKAMPDVVCCVFKHDANTGKMAHTGLHIGGGVIIHCSHDVEEGKTTDRGWTHYAIPRGLYTEEELARAEGVKTVETLKNGSRGEAVRLLQTRLNELGFHCGSADGIFGAITKAAVIAFQIAEGLQADGIAGAATQAALLNALTPSPAVAEDLPPEEEETEPVEDPSAEQPEKDPDRETVREFLARAKRTGEGNIQLEMDEETAWQLWLALTQVFIV